MKILEESSRSNPSRLEVFFSEFFGGFLFIRDKGYVLSTLAIKVSSKLKE